MGGLPPQSKFNSKFQKLATQRGWKKLAKKTRNYGIAMQVPLFGPAAFSAPPRRWNCKWQMAKSQWQKCGTV